MLNKSPAQKQPDRFEILLKATENLLGKVQDHESRITKLENRMIVDSRTALNIRRRAVQHVSRVLGSKDHPEFRKTISRLWHDYWNAFGVCSYRDTPAALYDEAIAYIDRWRPLEIVSHDHTDPAA